MPRTLSTIAAALIACSAGQSMAQSYSGQRLLREADYRERLRGMWLAECMANWTGLQTEGRHVQPPFLTDASWGVVQPYLNGFPLEFKWAYNPWGADDDTDIEYVYQHLMVTQSTIDLTPTQIANGWITHINRYIWVSNAAVRQLIGRGVLPPSTGLSSANQYRLAIDSQLTTEFFGALSPGMPGRALDMADLPIRTSSSGYATHASQFYVILYSLATQVPASLSGRDKVLWLLHEARRYVPDTSKSADVVDFVLADFLANPDVNDWERTRDLINLRYRVNAAANGFVYRDWTESSINLATGVMALLYGQGDYRRTIQVGTMSGWDSDNGTATMGGLMGLMLGYDGIRAVFNNGPRENFWIGRTRDNMPDYTGPGDTWDDTCAMIADRGIPLVRRNIAEHGGLVDTANGLWLLPPVVSGPALAQSPTWREDARSSNNAVRRAGGVVTSLAAAGPNNAAPPTNRGVGSAAAFANGLETSFDGREEIDANRAYYSSQGTGPADEVLLQVTYDRPVSIDTIRLIEGDHFADATSNGGWFTSTTFETFEGGAWVPAPGGLTAAPDAARPYEICDFHLDAPRQVMGVRVRGTPGGTQRFVTCAELDGLSPVPSHALQTFDRNASASLNPDDLYEWEATPADLDGDAIADATDRAYLTIATRWGERASMMAGR